MTENECLAVGDRLIESVGLLHSISLALVYVEFDPLIYELERLRFNDSLQQVKSLWARFELVVRELFDTVRLPLDRVSASLGAITPL